MLISPKQVERWASRFELNLFTGRTRKEFTYTFERWPATRYFRNVVTMDDARKKPHPDGLLKILSGRDARTALYAGDNIDDALAAQAAGVKFMAILPAGVYGYRERARKFRELGAVGLLRRASGLSEWLK
jgi:phosphoglycolate phosphatase-like HAD superfamily hydrolase